MLRYFRDGVCAFDFGASFRVPVVGSIVSYALLTLQGWRGLILLLRLKIDRLSCHFIFVCAGHGGAAHEP